MHNRDSKIFDNATNRLIDEGEWVIAIHDAILAMPGSNTRKYIVEELESLTLAFCIRWQGAVETDVMDNATDEFNSLVARLRNQ